MGQQDRDIGSKTQLAMQFNRAADRLDGIGGVMQAKPVAVFGGEAELKNARDVLRCDSASIVLNADAMLVGFTRNAEGQGSLCLLGVQTVVDEIRKGAFQCVDR